MYLSFIYALFLVCVLGVHSLMAVRCIGMDIRVFFFFDQGNVFVMPDLKSHLEAHDNATL